MDEKTKELKIALIPVFEWIKKYGNPYTSIVIDVERARVTEDLMGIPNANSCD